MNAAEFIPLTRISSQQESADTSTASDTTPKAVKNIAPANAAYCVPLGASWVHHGFIMGAPSDL